MTDKLQIETITKKTSLGRRTIGYRVTAMTEWGGNKREIAQFDIESNGRHAALVKAREALDAYCRLTR